MTSLPPGTPASGAPAQCPGCGELASGHFCANCGSPLVGARCSACATILTPGAKFCHRCGTAAGATGLRHADTTSTTLPWAIAGIALVGLVALLAGQRFRSTAAASETAAAPGAGAPEDAGSSEAGAGAGVRAPDISALSPRERADRLFDRIMRLDSEGKKDSVLFFAPMAVSAYQMIPDQDADSRFDLGRISEVAGVLPVAKSEADSILARQPTHLLGLVLALRVARASGDSAGVASYRTRIRNAEKTELAKKLPEYDRHVADIQDALATRKH